MARDQERFPARNAAAGLVGCRGGHYTDGLRVGDSLGEGRRIVSATRAGETLQVNWGLLKKVPACVTP